MHINRERFNQILREERMPERIIQEYLWDVFEKNAPYANESDIRMVVNKMREEIILKLITIHLAHRYYHNQK